MSAPAAFAVDLPITFQVGARTLLAIPRRMIRSAWSLDDACAGRSRHLPRLGDADGHRLTSVPATLLDTIRPAGFIAHVRQHYTRYYVDLTIGRGAWEAGLSAGTRQGLRRKAKRLAQGAAPDIRAYRTPEEIRTFHALARPLSARTYQARLLDAGLPDAQDMLLLAAAEDGIRAWLLFLGDEPVAYLCCGADGTTLRYDYVGHDPAQAHLSPGSVLLAEALRQSFEDRFARFDFTEGEGQHKRQFATGGVACVDLLLLRPTLANRLILAALAAFDGAMAHAKRFARDGWAKRLGDRLRRA